MKQNELLERINSKSAPMIVGVRKIVLFKGSHIPKTLHAKAPWIIFGYGNVTAIAFSVLLLVSGMADNVLKPLMLGRGVKAPMVVILLGGMATAGILGMFVGATLLTLGYKIFMGWVADKPHAHGRNRSRGRVVPGGFN